MSVRRLAEVTLQPPGFAFNDTMSAQAQVWMASIRRAGSSPR